MNDYLILTDSPCDLDAALVSELGIEVIPLSVMIDEKEYLNYPDGREIGSHEFYELLRAGKQGKTSALNIERCLSVMEPVLEAGRDLIYLAFSSALSSTFSAGVVAARQLAEKYPARKVYAFDTRAASMGQGLLVYLAAQQQKQGKSIDEVLAYVEEIRPQLCHWFTVDDLQHLKRGGRVSAAAAAFGTVLNIKPVLHVDDEGRLINVEKAQGRLASIKALCKKMEETAFDPAEQTVFISHGDCAADAEKLAKLLREKLGVKHIVTGFIGPVIGAHSGPGTVALFFLGKNR